MTSGALSAIMGLSDSARQRKPMADTRITIRLPQELYDQAKAKAKREDITLSQVLRRYLREWIKEDKQPEERPPKDD